MVKQTALRMLLTVVGMQKMAVKHVDVKTTYLYGISHQDIYMKQLDGFIQNSELDWELHKSLYAKC